MLKWFQIFVVLIAFPLCCSATNHMVIHVKDYGVGDQNSGIDNYRILKQCHQDALKYDAEVIYDELSIINIEIPVDARPIPLSSRTNFSNVCINVLNKQKDIFLFERVGKTESINVSSGNLALGCKIGNFYGIGAVIVKDDNQWIENRKGYSYGFTRKDVLLSKNGRILNDPIQTYCTNSSKPECVYCHFNPGKKFLRNLSFCRNVESTYKTFLVRIEYEYNVDLSGIRVNTPQSSLTGDQLITIYNCAYIFLNDIRITGTYSHSDKFGYGLNINNVYKFNVKKLYARAEWGVFGTNNINNAILEDCDINRFDIHCYGRDVKSINCRYSDLYNQFSSIYGSVSLYKCSFENFVPLLMESSFNAYTPFDLTFKNCTFNFSGKRNYIMTLSGLEEAHNSRPELSRKALPNITIKNCTVNLADGVKEWYIVNTGKVAYKEPLDYISKIEVNRLKINGNVDYKIFTTELKTTNPLKVVRKRVKMNRK